MAPRVSVEAIAAILGRSAVFDALDEDERRQLAQRCDVVTSARGDILFLEGDLTEHCYLVLTGKIEISTSTPSGGKLVLTVVPAGGSIGELSVIDGSRRSASAEVVQRAQLLRIPAGPLRSLLLGSPGAAVRVAAELAGIVRRLTESSADLVLLTLASRLAKFLISSGGTADGAVVLLDSSQGRVASRLGVSRQTLNQALQSFALEGLVEVDGRVVRILDARRLAELVHGA